MSQKQKQARNDYILIINVQKDFEGMVQEINEYYKEIVEEIKI